MKLFFTILFLFLYQFLLAQQPDYLLKENNIWTFGNITTDTSTGTGLNFNSGLLPTTIISSAVGEFGEAQASVCDTNGNLLFYTDGTFVLDAGNNIMPHGDSLIADAALYPIENMYSEDPTTSTTQGALIIPVLNNPNHYYLFSLTSQEFDQDFSPTPPHAVSHGVAGELFYSVVDMTLNNGLGDVVPAQRGIFLDSNLSESMVAIAGTHCDIWILVHAYNAPVIMAYNVTANGVNPVPVVSHCGHFPFYEAAGAIKVSPNRKKIVVCSNNSIEGGAELCNFDPATGIVSGAVQLNTFGGAYQACFSPDNSKIYVQNGFDNSIIQCDSQGYNAVKIANSVYFSDLQLGADGKIYFQSNSAGAADSIGCIASPDLAGAACNFMQNIIGIPPGANMQIGLHNLFVKSLPPDTACISHADTFLCFPLSDSLVLHAPSGFTNYLWSNGSTDSAVSVTGTKVLTVRSVAYCQARFDTFKVRKVDVGFTLGTDTTYCSLDTVTLNIPVANANYLWQDGSTDSTYTVTQSGTYFAKVSEAGCMYADTVSIGLVNVYQALGNDTIICDNNEQKLQIPLNANVPMGAFATWSNGSTDSTIIADTGTYWVTVTEAGCVGSDTITIQAQVCACVLSMPDAFTPNGDGKNDVFRPISEPGCPISEYSLYVYDRWGQVVFNSVNPSQGWDGTFHGIPADIGTYMYTIQYIGGTEGRLQHQKGDVTLVR